jgi:hypothetical protein
MIAQCAHDALVADATKKIRNVQSRHLGLSAVWTRPVNRCAVWYGTAKLAGQRCAWIKDAIEDLSLNLPQRCVWPIDPSPTVISLTHFHWVVGAWPRLRQRAKPAASFAELTFE